MNQTAAMQQGVPLAIPFLDLVQIQRAEGVDHVVVNGRVVLNHDRHTGALPGRVLRAGRRG